MRKKVRYKMLSLLLLFAMVIGYGTIATAKEIDQMPDLDPGRKGTLSVTLSYDNREGEKVYIKGVTLEIFRIADLAVVDGGSSRYTLTSDFEESGIEFEGMHASESQEAAQTLKTLVMEKDLKGLQQTTDNDGKAYFYDVEPGMYLVVQVGNSDSIPLYTYMNPYLVSVPLGVTEGERNIWNYTVDTLPKNAIEEKPRECSIQVTKRIFLKQQEENVILNGTDTVFYVGLFKDEAGTILYNENAVQPIYIKNSSVGTVTFEDLPEGIYYVYETDEQGKPIMPGERYENGSQSFVCELEAGNSHKISLDPYNGAQTGKVTFHNIFEELPDQYYVTGKIKIKKSVFRGRDKVLVDDTFYAGIFTKEENEYILNHVVEMKQNDTVAVEIIIAGEEGKDQFEFWVFETDEDGIPVAKQRFPYAVTGEGAVILHSKQLEGSVEIINRIKSDTLVQTGDDTQIGLYILILVISFVGTVGFIILKRKNNNMS